MSTRLYPIYQRGNPQLRIFLPNFWMKLIAPNQQYKQPPNIVQFHCSMQMTKYDVKNYLEKIYNIKVIEVDTQIFTGETKRDRLHRSVIKEDDKKIAFVTLPKDQSFVFPNLFKDTKNDIDDENINDAKKDMQNFMDSSTAPGLPAWFRI